MSQATKIKELSEELDTVKSDLAESNKDRDHMSYLKQEAEDKLHRQRDVLRVNG